MGSVEKSGPLCDYPKLEPWEYYTLFYYMVAIPYDKSFEEILKDILDKKDLELLDDKTIRDSFGTVTLFDLCAELRITSERTRLITH